MRDSRSLSIIVFVALSMVIVPRLAAAAGLSFVEPLATPLVFANDANGNGPYGPQAIYGIAKGDFNSDGNLDLAVTGSQIGARPAPEQAFIYVMLGEGDGFFQPPSALPIPLVNGVPAAAYGILVKDFDRDTQVDVLTVSPDLQQVLFFKRNGDGTFNPPITSPTLGHPIAVQTGDLNKDGILDLVTVSRFDETQIEVLIGNGNGSFQAPSVHTVASGQSDLALADFNRDGALDIVVTSWNTFFGYILLNDGHGGFADTATELPYWGKQPSSFSVADFDGDGLLDLVLAGYGAPFPCEPFAFLFVKGNGDGTFATSTTGNCIQPTTPTFAAQNRLFSENVTPDLNGDGHPDIVFVGDRNYVDVGLGDGLGRFATSVVLESPGPGVELSGSLGVDSVDNYALVTGDFNGDGVTDIAVANGACNGCRPGGVSVILGATPGTFRAPRSYNVAPFGDYVGGPNLTPRSTLLADFDHDDKLDLLFLQGNIRPQLILGEGDGTLQGSSSGPQNSSCNSDLAAADFDKDGNLDFACAYAGVNISWGNGNGAFPATTTVPVDPRLAGSQADVLAIGDVNGDTYPDVAFLQYGAGSVGSIAVNLYDPTHPRSFRRTLSFDLGRIDGGTHGLGLGDFNGDHLLDIVFHSTVSDAAGERFMIFLGNGDGSFQAPLITQPGLPIIEQLKTFDFNGDGRTDVMAVGYTGGFYILLGHGDATFDAPVDYPNGTYDSHEAQIVDFDGDGIADVALASTTSTVSVFKGNADGTFQPRIRFATGRDRSDTVVAGDLNGDGKLDMVVGVLLAGSEHSDFTVLINNSPNFPDLIVNSVSTPAATGAPGDVITINYSVQNTADAFAAGEWDDALYLSANTTLDAADIFVGTVHHTAGLAGGAAYPVSAMLPVPAAPPGIYRLIARANDGGALAEADQTNNTLVSAATITVQDVPLLIGGTPVSKSTQPGQFVYFRYAAQPGSNLRFDVFTNVPARVELYERFGGLPTRTAFDQKYPTADAQQQLRVNPTLGGTYYLLLYNPSGADGSFTLTVTEMVPTRTFTPTSTFTPTLTLTPTPTFTPTPQPTNTLPSTPTPTATPRTGDCDGNNAVTIDDLLVMVNVAVDNRPVSACPAGDANHDGTITVDEIIRAVNAALSS